MKNIFEVQPKKIGAKTAVAIQIQGSIDLFSENKSTIRVGAFTEEVLPTTNIGNVHIGFDTAFYKDSFEVTPGVDDCSLEGIKKRAAEVIGVTYK